MRAKFCVLEQTQALHLQAKFHLTVFIASASGGQKPHFGQILTFLGAPIPTRFRRWGPNLVSYSRPRVHVYLRNLVSIGLFCRPVAAKNPIFAVFAIFWISAFSDVANCRQSQKVEHGCTTTNLPLSNGIKIVSVLQRFHGEIGRTNSNVQKRDEQTDRQKLNVFDHTSGGWNPSPTKRGMVIRGPRACSCTSKMFPGLMHSFAARGRWKFGGNLTPSTPIIP